MAYAPKITLINYAKRALVKCIKLSYNIDT